MNIVKKYKSETPADREDTAAGCLIFLVIMCAGLVILTAIWWIHG